MKMDQVNNQTLNHDLPTLLRFLAITLIVAGHFGLFNYGGGGAALLMVIVGYNIATFKLPKVIKTGNIQPFAVMILKVAIPTIAYTIILHLIFGPLRYQEIFLISNYFSDRHPNGFAYWFIEVYIQIQLILLLLLAIPIVKKTIQKHTKPTVYTFAILSVILFIISESIWDNSELYRRLPWLMLWLVAFGIAARYASNIYEKCIISLIFITATTIFYDSINWLLVISVTTLVFNPPLKLPNLIKKPIYFIAAGSLFIYLTHFQSKSVVELVIPSSPIINILTALILGASIFYIYNNSINKILFSKNKTITSEKTN